MAKSPNKESAPDSNLDTDLDALFALPLEEFTRARNELAARLKKSDRRADADRVKALVKPSISAWAVNQLYWKHREAFNRLIAAGARFRQAQAMQLAGNEVDTQGPRDERREALSSLSRFAAELLSEGGHAATPETIRRITTTLEAISAYATLPGAPPSGRLTADVDPPGFEALAALIPGSGITRQTEPARVTAFKSTPQKEETGVREPEEKRQVTMAAARTSLRNAERTLSEARTRAAGADAALKRANAAATEAGERLEKARAAWEEAGTRARRLAIEAEEAAKEVEAAERAVEKASSELQGLPH
jgi:hypothetical protein